MNLLFKTPIISNSKPFPWIRPSVSCYQLLQNPTISHHFLFPLRVGNSNIQLYLFHWQFPCFLIIAPKFYTLLHSMNTRILTRRLRTVAAEARSSCITSSLLFAPTLRWWLPTYHDITTSICQHQFVIHVYIYISNTFFKGAWRDPGKEAILIHAVGLK